VSDLFISDGSIVFYEDSEGHREEFQSDDGGDAIGIPLIVLVNGNTASASEIVAGAVRDTHTGILVGENTFGKGLVQNVYTLYDGSGLVLTTGRYLTPDGHEITQDGLEPDIPAVLDPEVLRELDPEVDEFLNHLEQINQEYMELRQQMFDYLQEHDFQRESAQDIMQKWLDSGVAPVQDDTEVVEQD
jgi:C-terminal processing protease CtpA/Prc